MTPLFFNPNNADITETLAGGGNNGRGSVPRSHGTTVKDSLSWASNLAFSTSNSGRSRRASAMIPLSS